MSDDQTARLGLPYLAAGQMQKHVTLNEALTRLDAVVQTAVVSRTEATQPATPPDGALYILPAGAIGADWSGRPDGALMRAEAGGWSVVEVPEGLIALVLDAGELVVRDGGAWVSAGERLGVIQAVTRIGLGTTADAANPFAARLNKALWTARGSGEGGDGDLRLTFNKEGPADVLSLLFQSGWSGRAELGLIGDDEFRLKVSADGSTWRDVWAVDRTSGGVSFALGAARRVVTPLTADGSYAVPGWARTIEAVAVGGGGGAGGVSRAVWPAEQLASGLTVIVGAAGEGGVAAAGADGGASIVQFGSTVLLTAPGGGGGGLGDADGGGAGVAGSPDSNSGGASSVSAAGAPGRSLDRPDAPGGGGAGGGLDGSGTARSGGAGGGGAALALLAVGGSGGSGAPGLSGTGAPEPSLCWAGGGGGGGGAAASGDGHDGGTGGSAGGGGGGGGAGQDAAGVGGAGAGGCVWLIAQG